MIGLIAAGTCVALPGVAGATSNRTFASGTGADSGDCARPSPPCRTFAYALTQTNPGGEIIALDSGGYGSSLTIDREITITAARGVHAGMAGTSQATITVNAPADADIVLEHLDLVGRGAQTGILVNSGELRIRDLTITRFSDAGLRVASNGTEALSVLDSRISRNGNSGINVGGPVAGTRRPYLVRNSILERNGDAAVLAGPGTRGAISDSVLGTSENGIRLTSSASQAATVKFDDAALTSNATAMRVSGALAKATIARSTIADNGTAFVVASGGRILSYGDNAIQDNDTPSTVTGTIGKG